MGSKYLQDTDLSNEISLEQLAELVTKLGHPKTEEELKLAMQEMVSTQQCGHDICPELL